MAISVGNLIIEEREKEYVQSEAYHRFISLNQQIRHKQPKGHRSNEEFDLEGWSSWGNTVKCFEDHRGD